VARGVHVGDARVHDLGAEPHEPVSLSLINAASIS
jgi:hypothetical protein